MNFLHVLASIPIEMYYFLIPASFILGMIAAAVVLGLKRPDLPADCHTCGRMTTHVLRQFRTGPRVSKGRRASDQPPRLGL